MRCFRTRGTALALVCLILLNGCGAGWAPLTVPQPKPLDERTVLEFHAKNQLVRLHGVRFGHDSLSGIPWLGHLSCDTCRVSYALADISNPRTGNPGNSAWIVGLPMVAVVGSLLLIGVVFALGCSHRGCE